MLRTKIKNAPTTDLIPNFGTKIGMDVRDIGKSYWVFGTLAPKEEKARLSDEQIELFNSLYN